MDILPAIIALISIGLGVFGWLAPRYTMEVIDLHAGATPMGPSEVRAASGALFVGLGAAVLVLQQDAALATLGFAWGGAALGRATSLVLDGPTRKKWVFFGVEAVVAAAALVIGL